MSQPNIFQPKDLRPGLKPIFQAEGIVVNRDDPLLNGRVQVRVEGLHDSLNIQDATIGIKNDDLPWYPVAMPASNSSISGKGLSGGGILPGSKVLLQFTDESGRNGYVINSLYTSPQALARWGNGNSSGFQDPSGMYPLKTGTSVNDATSINLGAANTVPVQSRDMNLAIAVQGSGTEIPVDDTPDYSLEAILKTEEGYRPRAYWDVKGYSIGIGHFIGAVPRTESGLKTSYTLLSSQIGRTVEYHPGVEPVITDEEIRKLFEADISKVIEQCNSTRFPRIKAAITAAGNNLPRQWMLYQMAYQMGAAGLENFKNSLELCAEQRWREAGVQMRQSKWAEQTPGRAGKTTYCIAYGNLQAYGVNPVKTRSHVGDSFRDGAETTAEVEDNPWDPSTPEDTSVMWKEQPFTGTPEYQYTQVHESEAGHQYIVDNTPGNEQLFWKHGTSRNYEEWTAGGNRNTKVYADSREAIEGNNFMKTGGNTKNNIMGNSDLYIVGNESKVVDGNGTVILRGNLNIIIEGTANITVQQEATILVEKDTNITCNADASVQVKNKATVSAENIDVTAEKTLNLSGTDINITASNTTIVQSGVLSQVAGGNVQIG